MIPSLILSFFHDQVQGLITKLIPSDPHLTDNEFLITVFQYVVSWDHFVPITDFFFPAFVLITEAFEIFIAVRLVIFLVNVVRGSGAK